MVYSGLINLLEGGGFCAMGSPDADAIFSQELEFFGLDLNRTIRFARLRCVCRDMKSSNES